MSGSMRLVFAVCISLTVSASFAAKGGKGAGWAPSPTNSVTGGASGRGGSLSSRMQMLDPRNPPPLAPSRKVTPQDCSKPIAMDGGNLQCR